MMDVRKITLFLAVSLIIISPVANAQNGYGSIADYLNSIYKIDDNAGLTAFPVLNVPMGGRAEGMAMAFSAVSDDVSFIEYNPAGSSMLTTSELAFFHNNWIADVKIEGLAYAARIGNLGIAAGAKWLYTPFTEYNIYGERVSNGYYSEGVGILNASYSFLSGFFFPGLSFGLSLKGAFRIMPDYTDNWDNIISGSGMSQSALMGMADLGFLTRFNLFKFYAAREKNASAAFVLRNIGPPSQGEPLPSVINAAFSYKPIRPVLVAFDLNIPINFTAISLSQKPNMSLGVSANVTKFLTMHAGVLYRPGSSRFAVGSAVNINKLSIDINYSLDLLTRLQPLNRVSLGVRFDLGDGGRAQNRINAEELYILGLEAYSRQNIDDARLCWTEALRIDPGFDPAREGLRMLENRERLLQLIDEMNSLDF
jgi:hypothetical protein